MVGYYTPKKRASILLYCNVFTPKKYCDTTTFSFDFDGAIRFLVRHQKRLQARYIFGSANSVYMTSIIRMNLQH